MFFLETKQNHFLKLQKRFLKTQFIFLKYLGKEGTLGGGPALGRKFYPIKLIGECPTFFTFLGPFPPSVSQEGKFFGPSVFFLVSFLGGVFFAPTKKVWKKYFPFSRKKFPPLSSWKNWKKNDFFSAQWAPLPRAPGDLLKKSPKKIEKLFFLL